jgi:hypothetical protein
MFRDARRTSQAGISWPECDHSPSKWHAKIALLATYQLMHAETMAPLAQTVSKYRQ